MWVYKDSWTITDRLETFFEEVSTNKTKLVFKMLFNTADECRKVKAFAVDKNEEIFDWLENQIAKMTDNKNQTMDK